MRILRAGDYKRMPWKNGKGETVEIAVFPPCASVGDFDWRISMATVAEDGPFSVFDGIDRTLSILSGEGLELFVEGREPVALRQDTVPHAFPADVATSAMLLKDTVTDLNVMTRRGGYAHRVICYSLPQTIALPSADSDLFVLAPDGCSSSTHNIILEPYDALLMTGEQEAIHLEPSGADPRLFVIIIRTQA